MIVFPASGLVAASLDQSLKNSRIFWRSLTLNAAATSVSVSSESGDGPKDSPLRPDTAEFWEATALPATWTFNIDSIGSPSRETIDYVAIAGHTIGSEGASVVVATTDGLLVGSPEAEVYTTFAQAHSPSGDAPIVFMDNPRSVNKIRITVSGTGIPRLAVIAVGRSTGMQEPIRGGGHAPLNLTRQTMLVQSLSRGGQFLGQGIMRKGVTGSASFDNLTSEWYRAIFDPFVQHARQYPYFFAWRPEDYPEEVAYVWSATDIAPSYSGVFDWMRVSWTMNGIAND